MSTRSFSAGLLLWAVLGFPVLVSESSSPAAAHAEAVRPEIGKPLQAAGALMKSGKFKEALAKIREAESVSGKTPFEAFSVHRMNTFAAASAGDANLAAVSFEAASATGKMGNAEKLQAMEALVSAFYRAKNYNGTAQWAARYEKEGGTNPQITGLIPQLKFMSGDVGAAARELEAQVRADEKAGRASSEERLQLLANAYLRLNNTNAYVATLEKLVARYPKKSYWADIINRIQRKSGFSDRLAIDVYRLKLATGNLSTTTDYMELAQLSLQEGFNTEAKNVVEQAYAAGVMGTGAEAERHKRLMDLANKRVADEKKVAAQTEAAAVAAADGTQMVNLGFNLVTSGQPDKGLNLMEQGIAKGGLRRPEDATLRYGIALVLAKQKAKALQTLKTVKGTDGTGDLARLWSYYAQQR
ncbi:lipopolysaccharide assembly protein LapB [Chitinimonas sp. BJYL2]|uniref:tetratricopeptide repeat protein n=1 Tax=Chitinimonas sp. BJYL2 TaxID=2976696 RepID=UPI0022B584B5|nr:hypothetical protein [Chitinimonas sp. BJYL2]